MSSKPQVDFSMILASSIHDMKNTLTHLLDNIELFTATCPSKDQTQQQHLSTMQFQATSISNDLVKLLGLYRMQQNKLSLNMELIDVYDFLEELVDHLEPQASSQTISLELDCPENTDAYFDRELVWGAVNNALENALRHAKSRIKIKFNQDSDFNIISINDDGEGFPADLLEHQGRSSQSINFNSGSTSLGLYFSTQVAQLHQRKEQQGCLKLTNGGSLNGALFSLYLP